MKIQDNVEKVQDKAAAAIVRFGRQATVPLLNALVLGSATSSPSGPSSSASAGSAIRNPSPSLVGHLRSSYFIVRQAAVSALVRFGPRSRLSSLRRCPSTVGHRSTLRTDAADKRHPELQIRAIKALGGLEDHRAVHLLKELVDESLPDVQEAAMAGPGPDRLRRLGSLLRPQASSPRSATRRSSRRSCRRSRTIRTTSASRRSGPWPSSAARTRVKDLLPLVRKDRADFIRAEAVRVIQRVGTGRPEILEIGLKGLKDRVRDVRSQSVRLVGGFLDKNIHPPLLAVMADPHWSVRESAENALMNFGQDVVDPLIQSLESKIWTTRFRAARLLGEIGEARAVPALEKALTRRREQKSVKENVEAALRKLRSGASA